MVRVSLDTLARLHTFITLDVISILMDDTEERLEKTWTWLQLLHSSQIDLGLRLTAPGYDTLRLIPA